MTEAGLCNLALLRVGQRLKIQALTDSTPEAIACRTAFENARDVVLAEHPWSWATRRANLALVANAERSGWLYVYAAPSDMHDPREIWSGITRPARDQAIPYVIEDGNADTSGQVILCNKADAELIYTTNALPIGRYPSKVADAIAWLMGPDLAAGLAVKPQLVPKMMEWAMFRIRSAAASDVNRQQLDVEPESEFVRSR